MSVRLKSCQVHHISLVIEWNSNINLRLPGWGEVNGNLAPVLQRNHKLLLHGVLITSVFISLGIKLSLFQILRSIKQQSRASFPAPRKLPCLERYPDICKIGETHLSFDSNKNQEGSAIPLYYKSASGGATCFNPCVSLFFLYLGMISSRLAAGPSAKPHTSRGVEVFRCSSSTACQDRSL